MIERPDLVPLPALPAWTERAKATLMDSTMQTNAMLDKLATLSPEYEGQAEAWRALLSNALADAFQKTDAMVARRMAGDPDMDPHYDALAAAVRRVGEIMGAAADAATESAHAFMRRRRR
ncbi:hypothetical protein [Caenispirillum bisanense]|uniref:hypothetical protein n=1 Tax=Caenispirillum bisanense TaxID=414052 RepID=UPI0031D055D8